MHTRKHPASLVSLRPTRGRWVRLLVPVLAGAALVGCPSPQSQYDAGFQTGAASSEYEEYFFFGFQDSWLVDSELDLVRYDDSSIPLYDNESFDAGYYDAIWEGYNNGYFEAYSNAILLGFETGYIVGFETAALLVNDADIVAYVQDLLFFDREHGGFIDGYNDGVWEGRMFGIDDYMREVTKDDDNWRLAYSEWFQGINAVIRGTQVGSGDFGPVVFYVWGTDPTAGGKAAAAPARKHRSPSPPRFVRGSGHEEDADSACDS